MQLFITFIQGANVVKPHFMTDGQFSFSLFLTNCAGNSGFRFPVYYGKVTNQTDFYQLYFRIRLSYFSVTVPVLEELCDKFLGTFISLNKNGLSYLLRIERLNK